MAFILNKKKTKKIDTVINIKKTWNILDEKNMYSEHLIISNNMDPRPFTIPPLRNW